MKRGLNININFNNRFAYTLVAIFAVRVFAYGTSNPVVFEHSAGEIEFMLKDVNTIISEK